MLPQSESYTCQHGSEQEIQEVSLLKIPWLFPEKNKNSLLKKLQDITTSSGFWPQLTTIRFTRSFFFSTNFPSSSRKNIVEITVIPNQCFLHKKLIKQSPAASVSIWLSKWEINSFSSSLLTDTSSPPIDSQNCWACCQVLLSGNNLISLEPNLYQSSGRAGNKENETNLILMMALHLSSSNIKANILSGSGKH